VPAAARPDDAHPVALRRTTGWPSPTAPPRPCLPPAPPRAARSPPVPARSLPPGPEPPLPVAVPGRRPGRERKSPPGLV